jgi:hypothetical protein
VHIDLFIHVLSSDTELGEEREYKRVNRRWEQEESTEIMKKKTTGKPARPTSDEMRAEYDFDYSKAKPNRFASRVDKSRLVVALDPDVSEVFTTPEAVNKALRALIDVVPTTGRG